MLKCAILDDYQNAAQQFGDWTKLTGKVETRVYRDHFETEESLAAAAGDCDIIVAIRERTRFGASLFERLPKLKFLSTQAMKNAAIDLEAAAARGVVVSGTARGGTGTQELTWGLILGFARKIPEERENMRAGGHWQASVGMDLAGRTLGVLGLGNIGKHVTGVARAMGMKAQAWSQNLTREKCEAAGAEYAGSLNNLVATSDIITVHLVLSDRTRSLLGEEQFRLMKPNALVVNTSRGPIINEAAMLSALKERRIAGVALDTYDREPLPADHPLRTLDNVLATPHIGYVTEDTYRRYFTETVENIAAWVDGAPIRVLTKPR